MFCFLFCPHSSEFPLASNGQITKQQASIIPLTKKPSYKNFSTSISFPVNVYKLSVRSKIKWSFFLSCQTAGTPTTVPSSRLSKWRRNFTWLRSLLASNACFSKCLQCVPSVIIHQLLSPALEEYADLLCCGEWILSVLVLVFYCCITHYYKFRSFKQHTFMSTQFCRSEVWVGLTVSYV